MRFSYQVGMCDADHYAPLAQAAEAAGFSGLTIPDSICYPKEASSKYPYNKDGSREFLESVPFMESLIAVAYMSAVTEKIRFATFVYKLAVRQAAVVAKQVQSIQCLSGNRFDFGIGISPWEEDFAVCDVPWEKRGLRFDEQIDILRGLESGEFFGYEGKIHSMPANKMCPAPTESTPLLIGGHSEPALKRAAKVGDGWMCAGADMAGLTAYIKRLNELRDEYGTADRPFKIFTTGQDAFTKEGIEQLEDIGVTDVVIGFRDVYAMEEDKPLEEKIAMLQWYAGEFIKQS
ncbi:TIGR03619 family F420-dependent LLM class oxidoreductase [Parahaliea sp. F7430]|uniref:TIGR03619 family F420-dependent LLM class oxidoreductase n=1 Tax=Sediminihaliea albiluteola TaxID=2758564 RepID=A0A7W2TWK7_9GAMM|nr:TIGR03619 family F420-dependent LLM class oxidoreductase [Sediminihaliea albiluteola]MBA6413252.1 TIGR03619 family F420-dependent LLM class oxidoreductase [Sediminihaliea albiluteola]